MADIEIKVPVLILAGGNTPEKLQGVTKETERAFIPLMEKSIIAHIIENIHSCAFISGIMIIGNPERLSKEFPNEHYTYLKDSGSLFSNLIMGLKELEQHRQVLVMTADIPLITADILRSLLLTCQKDEAECFYPIVAKNIIESKFPGGERTYVTLREGRFTGGNVFLISPKAVLRNEHIFQKAIRDRKNPIKLARLFGLPFILRMVFGLLDIPMLEKKASKILGVGIKAIISPYPEIAFDIDKDKDFVLVTRILEKRLENSKQG